jgi:hypothetical protein
VTERDKSVKELIDMLQAALVLPPRNLDLSSNDTEEDTARVVDHRILPKPLDQREGETKDINVPQGRSKSLYGATIYDINIARRFEPHD